MENLSYKCPQKTSFYCEIPGKQGSQHKTLQSRTINIHPSGTTQSMVHSDFVTADDYADEYTTICCAHGYKELLVTVMNLSI